MKRRVLLATAVLALSILAGCGEAAPEVHNTPKPTQTQTGGSQEDGGQQAGSKEDKGNAEQGGATAGNGSEAVSTATPEPTATPTPEPTATPTPTPAPQFEYRLENGEITITKCLSTDKVVTVPATIDGYPVTTIAEKTFYKNYTMQTLIISEGIKVLADKALTTCLVQKVVLPESLTYLGNYQTENSPFLGMAQAKERYEYIAANKDAYISNLRNSDTYRGIPKDFVFDLLPVEEMAFPEFTFRTLEDGTVEITGICFNSGVNTYNLDTIVFPTEILGKTVTGLGKIEADAALDIKYVTLPGKLRYIGDNAFGTDIFEFTALELPETLEYIGEFAFQGHAELVIDKLPEGLEYLGRSAFAKCTLMEDKLPEYAYSFKEDGTIALLGSPSSATVSTIFPDTYLGRTVTELGRFYNTDEIKIPETVVKIADFAFRNHKLTGTLELPDGLKYLGKEAFYQSDKLEVSFNGTLDYLGMNATRKGSFENTLAYETTEDGVIILGVAGDISVDEMVIPPTINGKPVIQLAGAVNVENLIIECDSVEIPESLFEESRIQILTLKNGSFLIGRRAFFKSSIKNLIIENAENVVLEMEAFVSTGIQSVTIDAKKLEIGHACFNACKKLSNLQIADGESIVLSSEAFSFCGALTEFRIPMGMETVLGFSNTSLKELVVPASVKTIGGSAFSGCELLERVTFSEGLESIGQSAFYKTGVKEITIPSSVNKIYNYAFQDCKQLASVSIPSPESMLYLGEDAFNDCSKELIDMVYPYAYKVLEDGTIKFLGRTVGSYYDGTDCIPETIGGRVVTVLGKGSMESLPNTVIIIPETVHTIEAEAFYGCNELTELVLPETVVSIGDMAFYRTKKMERIVVPGTVTELGINLFREGNSSMVIVTPEGSAMDNYASQNGHRVERPE